MKRLSADKDSFGIFGFSFLDVNRDKIQGSTIEGVEIGLDSIQSYQYPVSRPLFFYVKKAHIGTVPGMKEYMSEFVGDSAIGEYGYLSDIGLVPLASDKYKITRTAAKDLVTITLK